VQDGPDWAFATRDFKGPVKATNARTRANRDITVGFCVASKNENRNLEKRMNHLLQKSIA
jgi:hypothetical protein